MTDFAAVLERQHMTVHSVVPMRALCGNAKGGVGDIWCETCSMARRGAALEEALRHTVTLWHTDRSDAKCPRCAEAFALLNSENTASAKPAEVKE